MADRKIGGPPPPKKPAPVVIKARPADVGVKTNG